tara:strand:+ start:132 stop:488 length:357 start_codon:yes stop_codon:yes gene_type:complete
MTNQSDDQKDILDIAKLKDAFMDDLDITKQILGVFQDSVQNFEKDFKSLENAGNHEELSRLVHNLKGSSANIRASDVANMAENLQGLIDQKKDYSDELNPLLESIAELEKEITKIKAQ